MKSAWRVACEERMSVGCQRTGRQGGASPLWDALEKLGCGAPAHDVFKTRGGLLNRFGQGKIEEGLMEVDPALVRKMLKRVRASGLGRAPAREGAGRRERFERLRKGGGQCRTQAKAGGNGRSGDQDGRVRCMRGKDLEERSTHARRRPASAVAVAHQGRGKGGENNWLAEGSGFVAVVGGRKLAAPV